MRTCTSSLTLSNCIAKFLLVLLLTLPLDSTSMETVPGDLDDFRVQVMTLLAGRHPELAPKPSDYPGGIDLGGGTMMTERLHQDCLASDSVDDCLMLIINRIDNSTALSDRTPATASWRAARARVYTQLIPDDPTSEIEETCRPFSSQVSECVVFDTGSNLLFVQPADLRRWAVSMPELHSQARHNLSIFSSDVDIALNEHAPFSMAVVQTDSGLDAAQLALPKFRARALAVFGEPTYAAIPSRSTLVFWPGDLSSAEHNEMLTRIAGAYRTMINPLTEAHFVLTSSNFEEVISPTQADQ